MRRFALVCCWIPSLLLAAEPERLSFRGIEPQERLEVQLQRPPGHAPGRPARYFWVLDGDTSFTLAVEAVRLVALECGSEPPVVVAIGDGHPIGSPGNRRSRDYTPVPSEQPWARGEGGFAQWFAALRARVLPAVERHVGPAVDRSIYGHSYGGLAVAQAWLADPALFSRWFFASAALYYADEWVVKQVKKTRLDDRAPIGQVLLSAGSEEKWAVDGNVEFMKAVGEWPASARPLIESVVLEGFGHLTGSPVSLMRAVRRGYCSGERSG